MIFLKRKLLFFSIFIFVIYGGSAWAEYVSKSGKFRMQGKIQVMGVMRTSDSADTTPVPIESGDLIQQRNTLMLEIRHNLGEVKGIELGYYLLPRVYYDGIWDYGPDVFSDENLRRDEYGLTNTEQISDEKWDAEIFHGYLDINRDSSYMRLGRQVFQWGEMTTLRILDACIPTDNQSIAVDLEERLYPLWLARVGHSMFDLGPFSTASIEGYYVPGAIEDDYGEETIMGSYIMPPIGRNNPSPPGGYVKNETDDDRYGVRLGFTLGELGIYLAHFNKYYDSPSPVLYQDDYHVEMVIDTIDVYGGSFNYYTPMLDIVIRGEYGLFLDEGRTVAHSLSHATSLDELSTFDIHRYGVAIDKNIPLRWLNPYKDIRTTLEYIGSTIKDHDDQMTYPWLDPDTGERVYVDENANQLVLVLNTEYANESLVPTLVFIYDIGPKTFLVVPKIEYKINYFTVSASYRHVESDTYQNMGFLQNDNEFSLKLTYFF